MTRRRIHAGSVAIRTAGRKGGARRSLGLRNPLPRIAGGIRRDPPEGGEFLVSAPPVPTPFDADLLYVECGRCGSPVFWEPGRTRRLLAGACIDPLELDASCLLVTDACPVCCGERNQYVVQIFRVGRGPERLQPPFFGNA